ncbi:hypothetical protein RN001_008778 [Aquatica leii]|uniref:Uncharacterized protein n=1 Tax=Aquatica leii TaxID=1421715 RepID=A0AAN7PA21_9COLE|nr:hypothetical protein RN001_008778 [Aquatica leii]
MLSTVFIVVSILSYTLSAPYHYFATYPQGHSIHPYAGSNLRPLPAIGDLISGSSWFPIEINVPEVFGNFVNGISSIPGSISNGFSGIVGYVQRIPFINRIISQERPRPYMYLLRNKPTNDRNSNLNMYSDEVDVFAQYP